MRPDVARLASPLKTPARGIPPTFAALPRSGRTPGPTKHATQRSQPRAGPPVNIAAAPAPAAATKERREGPPPGSVPARRPPPKPNLDMTHSTNNNSITTKGKPTSLMQPQLLADAHPFTSTLKSWRSGISVDCGPEWSWEVVEAAVARGPHPTATTADAIALFKADIAYQVKAGFSRVMLWEEVQRLRPPNLKVSPVAVVPQT